MALGRAAAEEVGLVAALRRAWTEEQLGEVLDDPAYAGRFADWWAAETGRRLLWVASVAGTPVGMLNVTVFERMPRPDRPPSRWGYLGNAFVLRAHRNAGIGAELLAAAVAHARDAGFVRLVLAPSERSVPVLPAGRLPPGERPDAARAVLTAAA